MVIARPEEVTRNGCFVEFLDEASFILVSTPVSVVVNGGSP